MNASFVKRQVILSVALAVAVGLVFAAAMSLSERKLPQILPLVGIQEVPADLAHLPVLHHNRIKPFPVAAEEMCLLITGSSKWGQTTDNKKASAVAATLDWLRDPEGWKTKALVDVPLIELRDATGLPDGHATLDQLAEPSVQAVLGRGWRARQEQEGKTEKTPLSRVDAAAAALADREGIAQQFFAGHSFLVAPLLATPEQRAWAERIGSELAEADFREAPWRRSVRGLLAAVAREKEANGDGHAAWSLPEADVWVSLGALAMNSDPLLVTWPDPHGVRAASQGWIEALRKRGDFAKATTDLTAAIRAAGIADKRFPSEARIGWEMTYRSTRPFTWAWIACIIGGIAAGIGVRRGGGWWRRSGMIGLSVGIACLLFGLTIRTVLSQQAAVTNFYETFPFVALVAAVLGLIFTLVSKNGLYPCAAGLAAGLCAMVGEALPPDLGSYMAPLQPVLRNRFWLWLHVKIIVASYGAFLLAWMLANVVLWRAFANKRSVLAEEAKAIYRVIQVGVVLCAAGTLLGGVWADYSWGRFWGWDPKEVWALVIILFYLVPLHLRYVGAVTHTGLAVWAVVGFMTVVMSWYGVNFMLGAGLHAYATGSGFADSVSLDQCIVLGLCAVQLLLTTAQALSLWRLPKAE